uniref:Uncharacterized protein n=1 Tax=Tanacetum cinerariifolium TaxID=118510 RepID=A0A6L2M4J1_TANCI|nr:hypothetical protein [Tanacetum cinerariifolium]
MLQIFPKLPGQKFEDPPFVKEILSFIRDLGDTGEIMVLSDVNVNHMYQPWRSFAAIINMCLSGKTTGHDSLRLSLENKNSKKNNDMCYPRFTKIIIDYIMKKDLSIPRRNKMFWHTARDDPTFTTIRVISKHQTTQIYDAILPKQLTNQAMIESEAYKTYYANDEDDDDQDDYNADDEYDDDQDDDNANEEDDDAYDDVTQGYNVEEEKMDEELTNEEKVNELYNDMNINLEGRDTIMTDALLPNVQATQVIEDTHVIMLLSLLKFNNRVLLYHQALSPTCLTQIWIQTLEFKQTNQFAKVVSSILDIVDKYLDNQMNEVVKVAVQLQSDKLIEEAQAKNEYFINKLDENIKKIIKEQVKVYIKEQVFKILPRIEKLVNEQLEAKVLTRSSNEAKTSHGVAANLYELEMKKILIDKIESNKSIHQSDQQKTRYKALTDVYETDKVILDTYGHTVKFKRRRDDEDDNEEPFAGSNWGSKRRRDGKEPESSTKPPTPDLDWNKTLPVAHRPIQPWISNLARKEDTRDSFNKLMDTPLDFSSGASSRTYATSVTKTKAADYGHIKWIEDLVPNTMWSPVPVIYDKHVMRNLSLGMKVSTILWICCQHGICSLTNLTIEERLALNVSLQMFTRSIVIQRHVEDLQLGIKRMKYLPQTFWRNVDKERAGAMIQAIDKQLKNKRIIRSLEKFDCDEIPKRPTMYLSLWSYKVVRHSYSNPMIHAEPEGSSQGYPLVSVEVLSEDGNRA